MLPNIEPGGTKNGDRDPLRTPAHCASSGLASDPIKSVLYYVAREMLRPEAAPRVKAHFYRR